MTVCSPAIVGCPLSLPRLVETLKTAGQMDPGKAADLLRRLRVTPGDFKHWFQFDHPACDSYGRRLVARGPNFELMVMSWLPGDYSAIHDHGIAEWGAVRYFSPAEHVEFEISDGRLCIAERCMTERGSIIPVDASLIHMMGNPGTTPFVTVHLYGRTEAAASITGDARIFDLWENRIQRTDGGVFYCLPENEIAARESCPCGDASATLLHHRSMLARIERVIAANGYCPVLAERATALRRAIDGGPGFPIRIPV